jgi:hypothetical protein
MKKQEKEVVLRPSLTQAMPVEIVQLISVLARIEARRQLKLRAVRKEVG